MKIPRGEWPRSLEGIRYAAEVIWSKPLHRYYTDHSVAHSERIIEKLNKLTEDLIQRDSVSPTEVFVLVASAYLHDIGMQDEKFKDCDLDQIREHHHELTREIIVGRGYPLGLEQVPIEIVDTIASVAEAHRRTNLQDDTYTEFTHGNNLVRPQLLAALLRLADSLDVDCRRVNGQLLNLMDVPVESEFHWYMCFYVAGVQIKDGLVTVYYQFPEGHNDYEGIVEPIVRSELQDEFPVLQEILWKYGCKVSLDSPPQMRFIRDFPSMPRDVLDRAGGLLKKKYAREIKYRQERIEFCDSLAWAALTPGSGEFR